MEVCCFRPVLSARAYTLKHEIRTLVDWQVEESDVVHGVELLENRGQACLGLDCRSQQTSLVAPDRFPGCETLATRLDRIE